MLVTQNNLAENNWIASHQFPRYKIPQQLKQWLFLPGSMTQYLRALGNNTLQVNILNQGWGKTIQSEQTILALSHHMRVYVRETILYCHNQPWMYGRSIFPITSLRGKNKFLLKALDQRPLGDLLYKDRYLGRHNFQFALLNTQYAPQKLWGRRSVFNFNNKPLLVTEVLLPAAEKFFYDIAHID